MTATIEPAVVEPPEVDAERLVAFHEALDEESGMRNVFRDAGFPATASFADGTVETRMDITDV